MNRALQPATVWIETRAEATTNDQATRRIPVSGPYICDVAYRSSMRAGVRSQLVTSETHFGDDVGELIGIATEQRRPV
ncbi:hypothetical protein [Nitrobacter sp.]|uniref:hypothetical protein n=1 Tax=Nitrobacter sp. TaxID=29420 RepID=UPI003F65264F